MTSINGQQIDTVVNALERVHSDTKQMIFELCNGMTEQQVVQTFNQYALDLFSTITIISQNMGKSSEYKFSGYKALFDNAIKINAKLPLEKFTLVILEYAPEIYEENEDCFMKMAIPDTNVKVGNEFNIIRSEVFKLFWKNLSKHEKKLVKETIILMTTYAHAYFYKSLLKNKK